MQEVNQSQLALNLHCSRGLVRALTDKGILHRNSNGYYLLEECKAKFEEYQQNIDTKKRNKHAQTALKTLNRLKDIASNEFSSNFDVVFNNWLNNLENEPIEVLNRARAYLTILQCKNEVIKVQDIESSLIPVDELNHSAIQVQELISKEVKAIIKPTAQKCVNKSAREIEEITGEAINNVLARLHQKLNSMAG